MIAEHKPTHGADSRNGTSPVLSPAEQVNCLFAFLALYYRYPGEEMEAGNCLAGGFAMNAFISICEIDAGPNASETDWPV